MKLFSVLKKLYLAVALAFWPCAFMGILFMDKSGWYELGIALYYMMILPCFLLPCFLAYLEIGACVGRLFDRKKRLCGELILGWAATAVAVIILASLWLHFVDALPRALEVSRSLVLYTCVLLLPILWIASAAIYKKELPLGALLRSKSVWIPALCLVLAFLLCGLCYRHLLDLGYRYSTSRGWYNAYDFA